MDTIEKAARDAIPALADFCLVHVVNGTMLLCVAGAHVSRHGRMHVRALMRSRGIRRDDLVSTVAHVVRTRRPMLRAHVAMEPRDGIRKGGIAELQHRLAPRSVLVMPIADGGVVLGALSLCYSASGRSYTDRHLKPAHRIAARIAGALVTNRPAGARVHAAVRDTRHRATLRQRIAPRH
jgi:GAF domain-containing protein